MAAARAAAYGYGCARARLARTDLCPPSPMDDDTALTLDIWLVRVLRTLLVERSVTQAALRLNQTQPAISTALRKLRSRHMQTS